MPSQDAAEEITPTVGRKSLPVVEILTGRGFITGKSGSGKSNTASVIAEELLENGYTFLVVDPEGEYYGLKEEYDLLHVGADEKCDMKAVPEQAGRLAELVLEENVPVILDVSDYLDGEEARELIEAVVTELYQKEKDIRKPCLLFVEEMQEYLPQTGGGTELAELLERVAKRGRKRGLGMLGMSQRPSSVDKDFITQCDWLVWHRLTWQNDLDVVRKILGSDRASQVEEFDTGEAFLMTDWDDRTERVKFKRKRTHDAGATPGLDSYRQEAKAADEADEADEGADDAEAEGAADGEQADGERADEGEEDPGEAVDEAVAGAVGSGDEADPAAGTGDAAAGTSDAGGAGSAAGGSGGDASGGAAADPMAESGVEALEIDGEPDVAELSRPELETYARRVARRNRNLADELRAERARSDGAGVAASSSAGGKTSGGTSSGGGAGFSPPPAPERPPSREGVAGGLVEFSAMLVFVFRVLVYKLRVGASRVWHGLT